MSDCVHLLAKAPLYLMLMLGLIQCYRQFTIKRRIALSLGMSLTVGRMWEPCVRVVAVVSLPLLPSGSSKVGLVSLAIGLMLFAVYGVCNIGTFAVRFWPILVDSSATEINHAKLLTAIFVELP